MGISGLWDAVSAAGVSCRVEMLRGKRVAIDASFWIGHCLASQDSSRLGNDVYAVFFLRICYLLEKRIFPIFVFDGRPPEAKRRTLMKRNMERAKFTRNLKLLAFKALAVQMKHIVNDSKDPVFKTSSFMKEKHQISQRELKRIVDELDAEELNKQPEDRSRDEALAIASQLPDQEEERLFFSEDDFEETPAIEENEEAENVESTDTKIDILSMPRSYRSLKMLSRRGVNVDITEAGPSKVLDDSYFDRNISPTRVTATSSRSRNLVELPIDCSIKKETYAQLPGEVRYQIMQQIKDAWMYDDRVNLLQLKSSLSEFSNLQVESYLRDVEINREIENIKRAIVKDLGVKTEAKSETELNLEALKDGSLKNQIFDYNSIETKTRKKNKFLNDLSVDMCPEPYALKVKQEIKPERPEFDDSAFLADSEIFGDLVKQESDEEFELVEERPVILSHNAKDGVLGDLAVNNPSKDDDWDVVEETYVPPPASVIEEITEAKEDDDCKIYSITDLEAHGGIDESNSDSDVTEEHEDYPDSFYERDSSAPYLRPEADNAEQESSDDSIENEVLSSDGEAQIVEDLAVDALAIEGDASAEYQEALAHPESGTRTTTGNISVSTGTAIMVHHDDELPMDEQSTSTAMYQNDAEYMDFLNMEKLLARVERRNYNKEQWEKVPELLELFGVPFMVAPSEAEAQCAHFNNIGMCYGVISDDSDTLAFGASRVFKRFYAGNVFEAYVAKRIVSELGLDREQLALLAIICGCDYTAGVRGIGVVNALEVIKAFPTFDDLYEFRRWATSEVDLAKVTEDEYPVRRAYKASHVNYRLHWSFCTDFPNREAYNLFLSPVVSSIFEPEWKPANFEKIALFMDSNSSLPRSEVATCLSRLRSKENFDGFIIEDFLPEIHARSQGATGNSLKSNRQGLKHRVTSFKEFLEQRSADKPRKSGARHSAPDSTANPAVPVAFIRSKRMIESIAGIKDYVKSRKSEPNS